MVAPFWTIVQLLTAKEELHKIGDISSVVSLWLRIGTVYFVVYLMNFNQHKTCHTQEILEPEVK